MHANGISNGSQRAYASKSESRQKDDFIYLHSSSFISAVSECCQLSNFRRILSILRHARTRAHIANNVSSNGV